MTLKPLNSQSLLCRPQSENVPLLCRLVGGLGCVSVGEEREDGFRSIAAGPGSVVLLVHLVSTSAGFGERERG